MAHTIIDNKFYADTAFLNSLSGIPGVELHHMGFGEFYATTPYGRVEFDRMRGVNFPGVSGRSHQVYDKAHGELQATTWLFDQMKSKGRSSLMASTLRTQIIRLAAVHPELRSDLLPLLKEDSAPESVDQNKPEHYYGLPPRGVQAAAKAPAKLKGKKLDAAISKAYYKYGDRVQVNIMDIGKIYAAGKAAYEGAATLEEADKALDAAMKAALEKYGTVSKVASSSFRDYDEAYVEAVEKANRLRHWHDLWYNRLTREYTVSMFLPSVDTARGEIIKPGTPLTDKQQAIADRKRLASRKA